MKRNPQREEQNHDGHTLLGHYRSILSVIVGSDEGVRYAGRKQTRRTIMSWLYIVSGVISLALFIYLFIALLKPEIFE